MAGPAAGDTDRSAFKEIDRIQARTDADLVEEDDGGLTLSWSRVGGPERTGRGGGACSRSGSASADFSVEGARRGPARGAGRRSKC